MSRATLALGAGLILTAQLATSTAAWLIWCRDIRRSR